MRIIQVKTHKLYIIKKRSNNKVSFAEFIFNSRQFKLSKDPYRYMLNFHQDLISVFHSYQYEPNCGKNAPSCNVKESFKKLSGSVSWEKKPWVTSNPTVSELGDVKFQGRGRWALLPLINNTNIQNNVYGVDIVKTSFTRLIWTVPSRCWPHTSYLWGRLTPSTWEQKFQGHFAPSKSSRERKGQEVNGPGSKRASSKNSRQRIGLDAIGQFAHGSKVARERKSCESHSCSCSNPARYWQYRIERK